jgi:hypothetical protein
MLAHGEVVRNEYFLYRFKPEDRADSSQPGGLLAFRWPAPQAEAMRLFLYTALIMMHFASNSLLNRAAIAGGLIGPGDFALIRLASGAAALAVLM